MGAQICCWTKEAVSKTEEMVIAAGRKPKEEQELVDSSGEIDEAQFSSSIQSLVKIAANGYPKVLRSTYAKRNELLQKHHGDMDAAATEVKGKGSSLATEAKEFLMALIPYVGLPLSVLKPLWKELRRGCLIAAVYGHDLSKEETLTRILLVMGVAQGGARAGEKTLELGIKCFWSALCTKCHVSFAKKLPVGKLVTSLADFEEKGRQALVSEFKPDARKLPADVYSQELDAKPTTHDLLDLVKMTGEKSLGHVREHASSYLHSVKAKAGFK